MQPKKLKAEQEQRAEKFRAIVAAWSDQRIAAEIEKRRRTISQNRDTDPAHNDALMQFGILAEVLRQRLGTRPRLQRIQTRGRRRNHSRTMMEDINK